MDGSTTLYARTPEGDSIAYQVLGDGPFDLVYVPGFISRAAELGDDKWQRVMTRHDELVRRQLQRFDGREVKHTGDGFLMMFDGPARAMRCATAILRSMPGETGLDARAGIHTGEVEVIGSDLRGLAVHVAARVGALAEPPARTVNRPQMTSGSTRELMAMHAIAVHVGRPGMAALLWAHQARVLDRLVLTRCTGT